MRANTTLLLGGPINGGLLTAMIWWVLNNVWKVGGVGVLQRQAWPLSSLSACAAVGAVLGLAVGMTLVLVRAAHASRVASLCQRVGFEYIRSCFRFATNDSFH